MARAVAPPLGNFRNRSVLITGATGSFGSHLARLLYRSARPRRLLLLSRDERKQEEMREMLPDIGDTPVRYLLGDVRDLDRLRFAFRSVDVIIHAAALKQIATAEYNPFEAIQTNVLGSQNVVRAALDCGVHSVMALSTDKAASPANLYGATKLCAEKLFVAAQSFSQGTCFACVRYGNVLGSRGSVVEKFLRLPAGKPFPITDGRMTRFWITLDQAVAFVVTSLGEMRGGEIFIPKLPSLRLADLPHAIDPHRRTVRIPLRPGEKMHEVLISNDEARSTRERPDRYVIQHPTPWRALPRAFGRPVPEDFSYRSDTNDSWLTPAQTRRWINDFRRSDRAD